LAFPVLLLSNDHLFSHIAVKILVRHDIFVVHIASAVEALRSIDRFQAAILDLDSIGWVGDELVRTIRSETEAPILAVSEANDPGLRTRALTAGASDLMAKAYMPDELVARTRGMLRYRVASHPITAPVFPLPRHSDLLDSGFASRR
jgi:two-component system phosphate regulon response regulator OmpR